MQRARKDSSISMYAHTALSPPANMVAISAMMLLPLPQGPVTSRYNCQS